MVLCYAHFTIKIIFKICEGSELKQTGFPAALGWGDPPSPSGGGEEGTHSGQGRPTSVHISFTSCSHRVSAIKGKHAVGLWALLGVLLIGWSVCRET